MTIPENVLLHTAVGFAATLYASVGHGGASAYLAMMALFSVPREIAVPTALLLNILVSAVSWSVYRRQGHFSWGFTLPFVVSSVPAAFLGGLLRIPEGLYLVLLALALCLAAVRFWVETPPMSRENSGFPPAWACLCAGAGIGLSSGMIGIGGGVFLSPLCLYLGWAGLRKTAATAACFILVNSSAGLLGLLVSGQAAMAAPALSMVLVAFVGGLLGARLGALEMSDSALRRALGAVLAVAGLKLFLAAY